MDKKIKVSIIIPAYNVEKYIKKCICSALNQTFENIEVIVINDGSTDNTRLLLNDFNDERLIIIDKNNGGVSAARNKGLDIATGDYIIFVDGDDYLANDHVEYMLDLAVKTGAEFCLSRNCYTKKEEKQIEKDCIKVLSAEETTALLLSPEIIVGCWNKIYSRAFLDTQGLRFVETFFYGEGLTFIITCSQLSSKVGVGSRKSYYYRRNNEYSATTKFNVEKFINGEKALKTIKHKMMINSENIDTMYYLHMGLFSMGATVRIKSNRKEKQFSKEYRHWKKATRFYTKKILQKKEVSMYRKLMLLGGCISPWIMMKLDNIRRKRISDNSVVD